MPTAFEMSEITKNMERDGKKTIDYERFLSIMKVKMMDLESEKELT